MGIFRASSFHSFSLISLRSDSETEFGDYGDDSEWTEFTDSFGRVRRCLKKDLPNFQAADESAKR